ncbi:MULTISPECIES: restriction endonuclease subunit S [Thomasclavelia]|nr:MULTISPECIES: restriction endonuclease subunit S [Thomasclavelia]MBV3144413.1 restriction endonuclease subunit S [Thomasclavelia ramosa]MBV3177981.1 restriction endonuclease subunit S [Thomasclavelia ramosa]MBV3181472.1 restriction endonuclease subunit S [Erysipelatoclostridium sp. MSK.23.67]MBV3215250.1 restriction endonuclease subunit S [Thomasclavelia ramosa]MBV3235504.1 restriction endonuclease subunit S [Thomasclavelia ramosa]
MIEQIVTLASLSVDGKGSYGIGASAVPFSSELYTYLRITDINDDGTLNKNGLKSVDDEKAEEYLLKPNDIVFARTGASTGRNYFYDGSDGEFVYAGFLIKFSIDENKVNPKYIKYYCQSKPYKDWINSFNTGSTRGNINAQTLGKMPIPMIERSTQDIMVSILTSIDEKIKSNNEINNNLLEQVLTLYRNKFVDTVNDKRQICRADEYFDISIGKTPPRKEPQWFSTNPQDVTWVSISDMGTCGLYINSSSEQLTREAIDRHNVKIVPDNTVLLSFKLTVGRIAITDGEITTNEAIAHFKTDKKKINEYLYCYLKCFNYQTMGSTSSIATAVNSKIIKGMPFVVPTDEEIIEFHRLTAPMFAKIKANQTETSNLTKLRDTLLPKLMSGELDISNIDL